MSFIESPRFPEGIGYKSSGGPVFLTEIVPTVSGREYRNSKWSQSMHKFDLVHAVRNSTHIAQLQAFFEAVAVGRGNMFRFKWERDYSFTTADGVLGTGVAVSGTTYQIRKKYTIGSYTYYRDIKKPTVTPTLRVYKNAVEVTQAPGAGNFQYDSTTGIVTFGTAPTGGDVLTCSGDFDFPVRFDTDEFMIRFEEGRNLFSLPSLPIIERRV
jgi:uncharacterized protein (TIGR02217 family)